MLSYAQFVAKHATKYRGLSTNAKRSRYQQYLVSQRGGSPKGRKQRSPATPKRQPRRQRSSRIQIGARGSVGGYARLLANPFTADTVGLPVFPSPPSSKVTAWSRGTVTCGTNGVGFIAGTPSTASDAQSLYVTGSTYADATNRVLSGTTGVTPIALSNLPVAIAGLGDDNLLKARVVLFAMRIRYIGTQVNLGGIIYPFVHPTHGTIAGYNETSFSSQESFRTVPVSRNWVTVMWSPIHRTELDFYHTATPPTHASDDTASSPIQACLYVKSASGNQFEYEVIEHIEYVGTASGMTRTNNPTPIPALADRIDALQDPAFAVRADGSLLRASRAAADIIGTAVGGGVRGFLGRQSLYGATRRAIRDEF